ncbi:MAG: hypothetical protein J6U04_08670 [Salinivirgaceae bacterium]|nr:hypothetical protein [Salinivirgaceae bacterium]
MRNKLLKSFALFALLVTVFAGCKKDEPTYTVQVTATEGGTVEGKNGEYKDGEKVVFKAVPVDGYYFNKWSDGNSVNPRTITIRNEDVTITAIFAQKLLLLTISASENGSIETDVNGFYEPGSSVTISAKPDANYYFAGWSDGNTENPRTITIGNENVSLKACFFAPTVDLGLESGTLWTTRNLGAIAPWNSGGYYAWGETETKDNYSWEAYKYCKGKKNTFTKYCDVAACGYNGFTDNLTTLLPEDDAATAVLGYDYSMPTDADWNELDSLCYWVWTENYNNLNVSGYIVYKAKAEDDKGTINGTMYYGTPSASYSLQDAHIFLPAAGYREGTSLYNAGSGTWGECFYWSSSLSKNFPNEARYCYCRSSFTVPSNAHDRYNGLSIRPVRRK